MELLYMKVLIILLVVAISGCSNTSLSIPVQGPMEIKIEGGKKSEPVIINNKITSQ